MNQPVTATTGPNSVPSLGASIFSEDASRREFELVLFWSLDRFSREGVLETLQHLLWY